MQATHRVQFTQARVPTHLRRPTPRSVSTLATIPTPAAVAALPATATLPTVPALPATATLPAVPTLPATATLPLVPMLPAAATLPVVPTLPTEAIAPGAEDAPGWTGSPWPRVLFSITPTGCRSPVPVSSSPVHRRLPTPGTGSRRPMTRPAPASGHALAEAATGTGEASSSGGGGESTGTVVVAGVANLAIAIAKLVGGLISHSSAMLSEAAHSLAATITEVLLFVALKRGNRPADDRHPFGYGRETYFWAFLAALCILSVGTGFSVYQGVETILEGEEQGSPLVSYVILAVGVRAGGQLAALIGVLLVAVAVSLARANVSLLIGQAVPESVERELRAELTAMDQVDGVPFLLTSVVGPGQLLVAAEVDFADDATVADIERAADEAERRLVARHPGVRYVFLDPTRGDERARVRAPETGELPD